jgi:hypothetical protein
MAMTNSEASVIRGTSPCPKTGKPVAAVDIDWDLHADANDAATFRGSIGAINLAAEASLQIDVAALGDVVLLSPARGQVQTVVRGGRLDLPIELRLAANGVGGANLVVTVRVFAESSRSRVISIPIRSSSHPVQQDQPGVPAAAAAQGEHTLTGSDGTRVHFLPATGQP